MRTPTIGQRIAYDLGRELPAELHEWVIHDLVGHGAMERYLVRFLVPTIALLALVLLLPGPLGLKVGMFVMMLVPLAFFVVSLSYVWRRFRMIQHGLDPDWINHNKVREHDRVKYQMQHGHR
ncbi:hypothetical protein D5S18_12765 [Nocardia panacis]|uniref:DUF5313 domain-containing protein n=1 Tax=Nocardia panacis TaxID=2340916 RepID=A0A3A4KR36_9NOCA|nr:DUF5313 family protein [Nocardia panacis]RJO77052.1 hypothetical protein D5S18_12765 [Nocardia panacis]